MKCASKKRYAEGGKINWSENEKLTKKTQDATEAGRRAMGMGTPRKKSPSKPPARYAGGGVVRGAGAATRGKGRGTC